MENKLTNAIKTYYPFNSLNANNYEILPILLGICNNSHIYNLDIFYENKLPSNWSRTILRVEYFLIEPYVINFNDSLTGIEIELLSLISDYMQIKIDYINSKGRGWGKKLPNGTYTIIFGDIQQNKSDLGIGIFQANAENAKYFDMSYNYMTDDIVWIVPKAKPLAPWKKFVRIFDKHSWITIFLTLLLTIVSFYLVSWKTSNRRDFWRSFESMFGILLASSVKKPPALFRMRLVFMCWCIHCVILKSDFDASFISTLTANLYETQIETQDDMIKAKFKMGVAGELLKIYNNSKSENDIYIAEHVDICDYSDKCLNRVAFNGNYATVKAMNRILYEMSSKYWSSDGPLLFTLKDKIYQELVNIYFRKGHPIFIQFNKYLLDSVTAGFMNYWESFISHMIKLKHNTYIRTMTLLHRHTLSFNHLSGSFMLLLFGLSIALIIFFLEIIYYRIKNNFAVV